MLEEKIQTLHPQGKKGVNITKQKYDIIKKHLLNAITELQNPTYTQIVNYIKGNLKDTFDGSINWYAETVKLDLEARNLIERTKTKPQTYKLLQK